MAFQDGLSSFLSTWSGVHTAYSFNQTNANTGTDSSHDANSSSYAQADTENYPNYGLSAYCSPDASGALDIYIVTDCCLLLYIPDNLATDEYALFHNGGGTHGQMGQIRSENNGTTVTLGITHNANGTEQDYTTVAIEERGWVCLGFQFEDNSGNMAIWVNGSNVAEISRNYTLRYGSGNPRIGDGNADGIPGWTAREEINGTGLLIANFVADNPNNDNTSPAGCGDSFYTDYYDEHYVAGGESHSGTAAISGNGSQSGSIEKGGKGTSLLSAAGALIVSGAIALFGIGGISGNGSLTASGTKQAVVSASVSGGGSVTATGEVGGAEAYEGTAAISGSGSLSSSVEKGGLADASESGTGALSSSGSKSTGGMASESGNGSQSGSGEKTAVGDVDVSGSGSLSGSAGKSGSGSCEITGGGLADGAGDKEGYGSAGLSGGGTLTCTTHVKGNPPWLTPAVWLGAPF